jgi:hypothetical protein
MYPPAAGVFQPVCAYDFVVDCTVEGRPLKMLTVIDEFSRECLAISVARSLDALATLTELFVKQAKCARLFNLRTLDKRGQRRTLSLRLPLCPRWFRKTAPFLLDFLVGRWRLELQTR